jgi:hypothetical protein
MRAILIAVSLLALSGCGKTPEKSKQVIVDAKFMSLTYATSRIMAIYSQAIDSALKLPISQDAAVVLFQARVNGAAIAKAAVTDTLK